MLDTISEAVITLIVTAWFGLLVVTCPDEVSERLANAALVSLRAPVTIIDDLQEVARQDRTPQVQQEAIKVDPPAWSNRYEPRWRVSDHWQYHDERTCPLEWTSRRWIRVYCTGGSVPIVSRGVTVACQMPH